MRRARVHWGIRSLFRTPWLACAVAVPLLLLNPRSSGVVPLSHPCRWAFLLLGHDVGVRARLGAAAAFASTFCRWVTCARVAYDLGRVCPLSVRPLLPLPLPSYIRDFRFATTRGAIHFARLVCQTASSRSEPAVASSWRAVRSRARP